MNTMTAKEAQAVMRPGQDVEEGHENKRARTEAPEVLLVNGPVSRDTLFGDNP